MVTYEIQGPDGNVYQIDGPEGARKEDIIRAIQARLQKDKYAKMQAEIDALRQPLPTPPVEPTIGGQVKEAFKGIVPGAIGLAETAGAGLAALLPEDLEKAARAKLHEIATSASEPFAAAPGYEDTIGRNIGQGLGSTIPFFALGPLGLAGRAAAVGLGAAAGAGEARQAAEAKGVTGEDRAIATALGTPVGLFDIVAPQIKFAKNIIYTALKRGGVEGATEAAQKVAQNLIAKGVYDPSQPILAGSGEEGAYGAGVGALASLLIDMTIGRRARGGRGGAGTGQPGVEQPGETVPTAEGLPPTATQADLFSSELRTAETAAMPPAPPAPGTQGELFTREEAPVPEAKAEQYEQPGQGDLFATPPAEETRTMQQPDLVDQAETAQIEEMMRAEKIAPEVAAKNEAELQRIREANAAKQEQERLKFESDLAELDGRLKATQAKTAEDKRLELLLPIIEDASIKNIPGEFKGALLKAGYPDTKFTPREQNLIKRAYDVRTAEPAVAETEPSAPATETEAQLAGQIKEKQPKVRQPEQLQLPGVPRPKVPAAVAEQPEGPAPLSQKHFDILGIVKAAPLRKRLEGKDFSVAADRDLIRQEFQQYMENPKIAAGTRTKLQNLLASPLFRTQAEMFGPKGAVLKAAAPKEAKNVRTTESKPAATGTSTVGTGAGVAGGTKGTTAPTSTGVGGTRVTTTQPKTGTGKKPVALKEEKKEPKKETKEAKPSKPKETKPTEKKEEKPKAAKESKEEGNISFRQLGMSEPEVEFSKVVSNQYKTLAPKDISTPEDRAAVSGLLRTPPSKSSATDKAAQIYFAKMPRPVDNLLNMAFDIAFETPQYRTESESAAEARFFNGMNARNARLAREWVRQNLSKDANSFLNKQVNEYMKQRLIDDNKFISALFREGMTSAEHDETIREYIEANKDDLIKDFYKLTPEAAIVRPIHPAVAGMLRAGNLGSALRIMSGSLDGMAGKVAGKLIGAISKVKVEVVDGLKDEAGKPVAGFFDPKTNTVKLDAKTGLSSHAVLHEATHAAVSHVLANKSHPVTKQLTQLYNDVKGWLDTAYGATSLDEFVSEAFSNPEFQAKLSAINPKGDKITAWQRFSNTVGNFLRRMIGMDTKPLGSALVRADNLISSILSTSPETRNAGVLYMASATGNSSQVFKAVDSAYLSAPRLQESTDRIHEFLTGKVPDTIKDIVRSTLPLHALADIAKTYIPKAPLVDKLVAERSGSESLRNQSIEPILAKVESWASKNPGKLDAFNATVYDSTLAQVDPTKLKSDYKEPEQQKEWDAMQANLKAIGPEGAALYKTMRDTYKKMYDEIIRIVNARIDNTTEDKERAKAIKTEIYSRLTERGGLDPYFPLTREGDKWLSYHAKNPRTNTTELYVEAFDSERARNRAIKEYEAAGATNIQKFANLSSVNYRNAPPTSFVNGILKTLEANKVNAEVTEEVMRFFLSTLPETSFAKAFQARKGTLGFKQDAVRALRQKTLSISRQLANMEYGAKLSQLRDDIEKDFRAAGQPEDAKPYMDALNEHIQFAISPQIPKWSKIARSLGFNMTLGFNISSAVVNVAQVPLIVAPYLGGKYGTVATTKALANASRIYAKSGFQREVKTFVPVDGKEKITVNAAPSLDNYDFDAKSTPEDIKRLKVLSDVAGRLGQLNRSQLYDTLEVTDPKGSIIDRINAWSGFVFHHGERMNRQITMIAAYNLELDKMKADGREINEAAMTEAAENAVYLTEMTNGGTSAAAAPRIAQSGLGAVMFMFKRYGASMYYLLFKTAREALKSTDSKTRKAAMLQIAGIYGSAALFAGARGLPMFGMVAMLYNLFKDDDEDDFETATRKFLGEGKYSGVLNAVTGLDISSRIGLSDLIFRDQKFSESTSVMASLLETMGGPVYGVASRVERGIKLIGEGHTERGIEAMLPSAMANLLRAHRYATEGTTTLRGDPITGDVSSWNVFAQAFGFAPAEYTRQLEMNSVLKGIDKASGEKKTKLLRQFYVATRFGDTETAQETLQELVELQKKHPGLKISADTIIKSMKQHAKTSALMYHGITLSKGMRTELLRNASEFDEGFGEIENPFTEEE